MKIFRELLAFLMLFGITSNAQTPSSQADYIKSFVIENKGSVGVQNIFELGKPFAISFDDLNADERNYYYKFTHCDWDWSSSNLLEAEFVKGYAQNLILDFTNSFNTLVGYTHYFARFPNEDTRLKISGNYLLSILNEDEEVVATKKIVLYEPKVLVNAVVSRSNEATHFQRKQAVKFTLNLQKTVIRNPAIEIIPMVIQNNRLEQAKRQSKPQYMLNNSWVYQNNKELEFWANNEFLHFDTKSTISSNVNIKKIESLDHCHVYLYIDEERSKRTYKQAEDINGGFVIRNTDFTNALPATEADYLKVHFSLDSKLDKNEYNIYVIGGFNDWKLNQQNAMFYNPSSKKYEVDIMLKQGFYNYDYLAIAKNGQFNSTAISGSFFETENDYQVVVYYKEIGARFTRVIGLGLANSLQSTL